MRNKSKPLAPVILIDLAADDAVSKLEALLDGNDVVFTHGAPPCGTASNAREIPIPLWKLKQGAPNILPLRSSEFPAGLKSLKGDDKIRVLTASRIYANLCRIIMTCHARHIIWLGPSRTL